MHFLTDNIWHPRDNHEVICHGLNIVDLELSKPLIQVAVKDVHEVN